MAIPKRLHQIGFAALLFLGFLCQAQAAVVGWGGRDVTFTPALINGPVNTIIQLKVGGNAGKYLIGGSFTSINGLTAYHYVARLNANGTLDTSFTPPASWSAGRATGCFNGDGSSAPAIDVRALLETQVASGNNAAGSITIGGNFTSVGGATTKRDYLFRVGVDGAVDPNFYPTDTGASGGTVTYTHCVNMMFTGEGSGSTLRLIVGNNADPRVSKKFFDSGANATGFTQPTFAASPVTTGFYCTAAMGCPGNRYVIGGAFGSVNSDAGLARLVRLETNGNVDITAYPTSDGTASGTPLFTGRVNSIALDSTSEATPQILVGGRFTGKLARVALSNFAPAPPYSGFDNAGFIAPTLNGDVWSVAVDSADPYDIAATHKPSYLFSGSFTDAGGFPQCDYVCNSTAGGYVSYFFPTPPPGGVVRVATVNSYADTNVGKYMIGGAFTALGGNAATNYVARLNQATPASITINSAGPDGIRTVYSNGQWQVYRAGSGQLYFPDTDPPLRYQYNQIVLALTDGTDHGYIIGPSTTDLGSQNWDINKRLFRPWDSVTATQGGTPGLGGTETGASDLSVQVDGRTYVVHMSLSYTYPNDHITQTFTVDIPAGNTYNVKLYNLYDSYLGGSDIGPGFYNASSKIVGVSGQTVIEGLRYVSGKAWDGYMSAYYGDVVFSQGINHTDPLVDPPGPGFGTNLDNSIITDPTNDNGFGVNWDFGDTAGPTDAVAVDFIFSDFVAPTAAATANPGEIKVEWDPTGITPAPDSYVVTAYDGSTETTHTCTVSAPSTTCTVTGLNPAILYTFLVDFRSGGSSVFNAGSNDAQPLPYQLSGWLWRDNGAGGGGKENGLKLGAEPFLDLPATVGNEAGYVVILDITNHVVARARVCVNPTTLCEESGQFAGEWKATTIEAEPPFSAYVTDEANRPQLGDPIELSPSPAVAPTGFGFTIPNANNLDTEGAVPNGLLTGINPSTLLFSLNFGVVSNSCAIP